MNEEKPEQGDYIHISYQCKWSEKCGIPYHQHLRSQQEVSQVERDISVSIIR